MSEDVDWGAYVRGTRSKYVTRYLAYAEAHDQPTAVGYNALEAEQPNVLVAMDRAYQEGQWDQVRRFGWALCRPVDGFLRTRGYWAELRERLDQAIRAAETEGNKEDTASFIRNLAIQAQDMGEYAEARRLYRLTLDTREELGDRAGIATSLHDLARLALDTGKYAEARRLYRQSLDISEELGNQAGIGTTLQELGAAGPGHRGVRRGTALVSGELEHL